MNRAKKVERWRPPLNIAMIPQDLKNLPNWVFWRYERDAKGELTKVPYEAKTGNRASSADPGTWSTFEEVMNYLADRKKRIMGIGFVVNQKNGFCGIDLDHCRDPETQFIELWAKEIISSPES